MQTIKNYNVMLVDDEALLMNSLERHIAEINPSFKVVSRSSDGENALVQLKRNNIHLVITDIKMPVVNGLQLVEKIHKEYPHILAIIVTGYADFEYARNALKHGVFDYLLKPISPSELEDTLGKANIQLQTLYQLEEETSLIGKDAKQIVEYALFYIREHYMNEIDFKNFANTMGFSPSYLTKLFNRHVGESPIRYLTRLRINEAKRLLLDTNLPIQKVGEKVGYPDQFHFSKTFRKIVGKNPKSYREEGDSN